jgi:hypothetical protein
MKQGIYSPDLLPEEHIYGFLARTMFLNAAQEKYKAQAALCADNRALLASPIYQTFMPALVTGLSEQFGLSTETLYRKHSMLGFYRHAMDCGQLHQIMRNKVRKDIYPIGAMALKTTKWRYCPVCIEADQNIHGTDYWHVEHQLPTSLTCHLHGHVLLLPMSDNQAHGSNDLRKTPRPSHCASVTALKQPQEFELNGAQVWLQQAGLELFNDTSKFVDSKYKYALTYEVPFRFTCLYKITSTNNIFVCDEVQGQFLEWLLEHQLDMFFSKPLGISELKTLRIDRLKYSPLSSPILYHLLWLRFLGAKNVGDAYRDVSSVYIAG